MPPTKHLPNGTYPYNHNNRNSTSTSSFTTSISTNSLTSKLDTNINHHRRCLDRDCAIMLGSSTRGEICLKTRKTGERRRTIMRRGVGRLVRGGRGGTYSHGYEYDHEYGYASYGEHGPGPGPVHGQKKYDENLLFSDFNEQNPPNGGPHSRKYEAHGHDHTYADHGGEQGTTKNTRGTYTFLQNPNDRLGRYESSDSVPADQLVRFTPIGHYGYSPLTAGRPVSPPRRILTPARYAETNRMEREKSDELKQKQRGFWGPVRALWVSLRRSR
ncbi:hypothetical protein ANOM_007799 [Aspergillus nomiae NRRL 13137]|uniref:Uncharacterized protein n=1 Tax=Aspergillus nomiae NRRL (strain ATCC 15546 / NRRL 13137 / CBS 260.88 / M93) TaxID=1509407 RepID=A0A0L1J034_ASPN3|nr:uncharacterized protein ANOM_007799 [Aspergillus nomiae NRRL 13137]KNG85005.1 hypothetical protein ANOM_007799 [Aspergillus nomiae NRRL 13137]